MTSLLLIDDEPEILDILTILFSDDYEIFRAEDGESAMTLLSQEPPDVILSVVSMPRLDGMELLSKVSKEYPDIPVILLTGHSAKDIVVKALRSSAFDFLEKPFNRDTVMESVARAVTAAEFRKKRSLLLKKLEKTREDLAAEAKELEKLYSTVDLSVSEEPDGVGLSDAFGKVITRNSQMISTLQYLQGISETSLPILITGETGSGKDVIANAIHVASKKPGAFVPANVAGLDDNLLADTLFGHVKGAFTNANSKRSGLIEAANDGTLFLDEIGDLSHQSQIKLLRLLESGEYYPLGADKASFSNARIVCATHQDIEKQVEDGSFRKDLFYRIESHWAKIIPLRDRSDDLPYLINSFLNVACEQLNKPVPKIPKEITTLLSGYSFPGNVRELRGMIFDAIGRHSKGILSLAVFKEKMATKESLSLTNTMDSFEMVQQIFGEFPTLKEAEDRLVQLALEKAEGNQTIAAQYLGLSRQALTNASIDPSRKSARS